MTPSARSRTPDPGRALDLLRQIDSLDDLRTLTAAVSL
jgi:hypothetical protein